MLPNLFCSEKQKRDFHLKNFQEPPRKHFNRIAKMAKSLFAKNHRVLKRQGCCTYISLILDHFIQAINLLYISCSPLKGPSPFT